jgi:hypothetical protein
MGPDTRDVFVDTSIQIGRTVHRPEIQQSIATRLAQFSGAVTGLQVRREFKRRLLQEAQYLLSQFALRNSYQRVRRHIEGLPATWDAGRKKNICLQTLSTIFEAADDEDLTERSRRILRDLLRFGMTTFDAQFTKINRDSGCVCATQGVAEKKPFLKYEFGIKKCDQTGSNCRIGDFLTRNQYCPVDDFGKLAFAL